jgi:hypothetical protein
VIKAYIFREPFHKNSYHPGFPGKAEVTNGILEIKLVKLSEILDHLCPKKFPLASMAM